MKETIFKDIYNQYQPDRQIADRLMDRVRKEKSKAIPFKPIIAVASAAAGLALCFAATKLLPSGPNIEVVNPAAGTTTTTTYKSNIIINTEPVFTFETPPGATTAPCYGPSDETTTAPETRPPTDHTWGDDTTDATCAHEENPEITCACIKTTTATLVTDESEIETKPIVTTTVTSAELPETSTTTEATASTEITTTTLPVVAETATEESTEEESTPEVAYEDTSDMKEMPVFDTFGEYCDYFKLWDKLDNVHFTCQLVSDSNTTKIDTEIDGAVLEEVLSASKDCKRNINAPYHYKNVQFHINGEISVHIQKSGSIQLYVENYNSPVVFEGDAEIYNKLLRFAKGLGGGEVVVHTTTSENEYVEGEMPPEGIIEPDEE